MQMRRISEINIVNDLGAREKEERCSIANGDP